MTNLEQKKFAVLIPCFNEGLTIQKVIIDFKNILPNAEIIVFDNNSTDDTYTKAILAGAKVIKEKRQGKGAVINSMLKKVTADIYVMVDGDDTYPAESVLDLIAPVINEEADMVVGQRLSEYSENAFRSLHISGNKLVCKLINMIFSSDLQDPMSGYRVFTRELAMELPVVALGFDVETEMTIQLLYRKFVIREIPISYRSRPAGSESKLNTFKDGFKVLYKIFSILQAYKPLTFFGGIGLFLSICGIVLGSLVVREYLLYQYIYSVPKAILATGLIISAVLSVAIGIILHTLNFRLLELSSNANKMLRVLDNLYSNHK